MKQEWTTLLEPEDLEFIKEFILASGSLKQVAGVYGVSYPTLRLRLDRLITKIQMGEALQETTATERLLRSLYADGRIDEHSFHRLLAAHAQDQENMP